MKRFILILAIVFTVPALAGAAQIVVTGAIDADTHWTAANTYLLNGPVWVTKGHTLTIDAGTVIRAEDGQLEKLSCLIISQGAKINAVGTATNPIIFTTKYDTDLNSTQDVGPFESGFWGGVLLCGYATTNNPTKVKTMEGFPETWTQVNYGGDNDHDNSGVMKYCSIRHTGIVFAPNKEMQGLTCCAVGDSTVIDYMESYCSGDDGAEFFGGTVNLKHCVSAFAKDDTWDTDEGFRGKFQFVFSIQSNAIGNDALREADSGTLPEDAKPYAIPQEWNCTYLGTDINGADTENKYGLIFRDNSGGLLGNNIIGDLSGSLMYVETPDTTAAEVGLHGQGSIDRVKDGTLLFKNNIFFNIKAGSTFQAVVIRKPGEQDIVPAMLTANNNTIEDPKLGGISRVADRGLNPIPAADGPAYKNLAAYPADPFWEKVNYKGAFGATNWMLGWTALDKYGFLKQGTVTAVAENTPVAFDTVKSWPNPFNPTTTITYTLVNGGATKLSVFDITGQKIATLVDGQMTPGTHHALWNAENFSNGTYLCILENGGKTVSSKMTLLK